MIRAYEPLVSLNKALLNPYFLRGAGFRGGVGWTSHECRSWILEHDDSKNVIHKRMGIPGWWGTPICSPTYANFLIHCITLRYIALQCITLPYAVLHYIALHHKTVHYGTCVFNTWHEKSQKPKIHASIHHHNHHNDNHYYHYHHRHLYSIHICTISLSDRCPNLYCMFSVVSQKRLSLFRIFIYSRKHAPNTWSWMKWIAQLDVAGGLTHTESMEITNDPRFFQDRLFFWWKKWGFEDSEKVGSGQLLWRFKLWHFLLKVKSHGYL